MHHRCIFGPRSGHGGSEPEASLLEIETESKRSRAPSLRDELEFWRLRDDVLLARVDSGWSAERHVLQGSIQPLIVPWIDGQRSLEQIVDQLDGRARWIDVQFGADLLARAGLLGPSRFRATPMQPRELSRDWEPAKETKSPRRGSSTTTGLAVSIKTHRWSELPQELEAIGRQIDDSAEDLLWLTEDWSALLGLEPVLPPFPGGQQPHESRSVRNALAAGRTVRLARCDGRELWLAPPLSKEHTPCLDCLSARLRANRRIPVGAQLLRRAHPQHLASSVLADALAGLMARQARQRNHLLCLDLQIGPPHPVSSHWVLPLPGCARCAPQGGRTPSGSSGTARRPIPVARPPRVAASTETGWRKRPAAAVFDRLRSHISPLCGIVRRLETYGDDLLGPSAPTLAEHTFAASKRIGTATDDTIVATAAGKGLTRDQSKASALCEALERYSGLYREEPQEVVATFQELGDAAVHPNAWQLYSDHQFATRREWNSQNHRRAWIAEPLSTEAAIGWTPCRSLIDGRTRYLPTALCWYEVERQPDRRFARADSNGCAAGNDLEEATLQGFLELVERDAVAIWWYQRIVRPAVPDELWLDPPLEELLQRYRHLGWSVSVLDLTHDFGIPVLAATAMRETGPVLVGFGCHFDVALAARRALTELNQFLPIAEHGNPYRLFRGQPRPEAFLRPAADLPSPLNAHGKDRYVAPASNVGGGLTVAREVVARLGLDLLRVDQTDPLVDLSVVRVIVPGLRHFWPRFAPGRLFDVPVQLGWMDRARSEDQLNPVHLLI